MPWAGNPDPGLRRCRWRRILAVEGARSPCSGSLPLPLPTPSTLGKGASCPLQHKEPVKRGDVLGRKQDSVWMSGSLLWTQIYVDHSQLHLKFAQLCHFYLSAQHPPPSLLPMLACFLCLLACLLACLLLHKLVRDLTTTTPFMQLHDNHYSMSLK
jgi:hypothetical protein